MNKQLLYKKDAREKLQAGVNKLAEAVTTTLGPRGRNVAIERSWAAPVVLHDGVSVAKEVFLDDRFENMGAQLVKEAAQKTNDQAGDGTTTATLVAQFVVNEGMEKINTGTNPMFMKKGLDRASEFVNKELLRMAKKVKRSDWKKVATISAQSEKIGKKIDEALKIVGKNGMVDVDEGGLDIEVVHSEGMEFGRGYLSPYFVTDVTRMECVLDNPLILISDMRISSIEPLTNFLSKAKNAGRSILLIGDAIEGDALATLFYNKIKGVLNVCAVQTPVYGADKADVLEDIAILTNGRVISSADGSKLEDLQLEDCGICDKVVITRDSTRIIGGDGTKEEVDARIVQLKEQAQNLTSDFDKTRINERVAKLSDGVAIIKVGATTETEVAELKERVKDAVGATKSAIEEGIIPGGGVALLQIKKELKKFIDSNFVPGDEQIGAEIVYSVLSEPTRKLAENSGVVPEDVLKKLIDNIDPFQGFNVNTLEYGNMMDLGIIDPVKVTRLAVLNGISVASMILTTEVVIADKPEDKK